MARCAASMMTCGLLSLRPSADLDAIPGVPLGGKTELSDALQNHSKGRLWGHAHSSICIQEGQPRLSLPLPAPYLTYRCCEEAKFELISSTAELPRNLEGHAVRLCKIVWKRRG